MASNVGQFRQALRIPGLIKEKVTVRYFWTLLKAIKGKIIENTHWKLAYAVKQTRIDSMVNTVSYVTFLQCIISLLFVVTVNHLIGEMLFDTCYYFSVVQSLLFCSISVKPFLGKFSLWVYRSGSDTKMTKTSHTRFVCWQH